jgi:leucyl-tRNA synthetase
VGQAGIDATIAYAEEEGFGKRAVHYRLRDWLVSRQRYWGTPIPIVHCRACGLVPVPEAELPVRLPEGDIDYVPKGRSPLADVAAFMEVACPSCGGQARRDPDTMDTFVDSAWYFLRYLDPHNGDEAYSRPEADRWLPVDLYIGGITHATGHLLYFRFITKVLYDKGLLSISEPSLQLFNHGLVLDADGQVMSKSLGNVVSPIEFMEREGADVARLTMFFASPAEKELLWSDAGAVGAGRFLDRLWRILCAHEGASKPDLGHRYTEGDLGPQHLAVYRKLQRTIHKANHDFEALQFNTVLAALMEFQNEIGTAESLPPHFRAYVLGKMVQLLAPMAPHFAEEAWAKLGFEKSILRGGWPTADREALGEEVITVAVQVNGKVRGQLQVHPAIEEAEAVELALSDPKIAKFVDGAQIKKTIFVRGRLLSIVV